MKNLVYIFILITALILSACEAPQEHVPREVPPAPHQQGEEPPRPEAVDVSQEELDEFVRANQIALDQGIDPLVYRAEMEEILEDMEIDYERFLEINRVVINDPELHEHIRQRIVEENNERLGAENELNGS